MSSLHVRARTECASAASSLCLGLYPVACSFSRGKETQCRELPCTLTRPQLGPGGEDSSLNLPSKMCSYRENNSAFLCEQAFLQERYRDGCSPVRWCMCKGQDQDSPATSRVTRKLTPAKRTGRSGGCAASLPRGVYPRKDFSL